MAWLLVLLPLAAAAALAALRRRPAALLAASVGAMAATLVVGIWAAAAQPSAGWRWGGGIVLGLSVEGLGRVMVVLVPAVALPVTAYAAASMRYDPALARLLALLAAFVGAMLMLVAAADLLTVLVAWELVGAGSWALVAHDWRDPERPALAGHAFLTTRVGDLGLIAAAAVALGTGTGAHYTALASLRGWPAHVVAGGLLVAAAAKSAQRPFRRGSSRPWPVPRR